MSIGYACRPRLRPRLTQGGRALPLETLGFRRMGFSPILSLLTGFLFGIAPWYVCLLAALAGVIGTNLDSLYGALLENRGVFGNSGTNLLATLSGGLAAAGLYLLVSLL